VASFVESATLLVKDQSTAKINKINASLKKLFATAKALKSTTVNLNVNTAGIQRANQQLNSLARNMAVLRRQSLNLNVNTAGLTKVNQQLNSLARNAGVLRRQQIAMNVNTAGITRAQKQITALRTSASRPINVNVNSTGGPGAQPGARPGASTNAAVAGRRAARGGAGAAIVSGAAAGSGITGLSTLNRNFGILATSAYAAAAALRQIGEKGYERARTTLQEKTMNTPEMLKEYERLGPTHIDPETGQSYSKPMPENQARQLRSEITADVAATNPDGSINREQTARQANTMMHNIQRNILPGLYNRNPNMTPEQVEEKAKFIIKGGGMATTEMFDDKGALSADWMRYQKGIGQGLALNPDIPLDKVRNMVGGMKSAAFQLNPEAFARTTTIAGERGAAIGNQLFQYQQSMRGVVDNKKLNKELQARGMIAGPTDAKGNPIPGKQTVMKGANLIGPNPYAHAMQNFGPDVLKAVKQAQPEIEKQVLEQGEGQRGNIEQSVAVDTLSKILPSIPKNTLQFMSEAVLGDQAWRRQHGMANLSSPEQDRARQAESPAAAWDALNVAVADAAGKMGEFALGVGKSTGVFEGLTKMFRGDVPGGPAAAAVGGAAAVGAVGWGAASLVGMFTAPVAAMNASAAAQLAAAQAMNASTVANKVGGAAGAAGAAATGAAAATGIGVAGTIAAVAAPVAAAAIATISTADESEVLSRMSRREAGENVPTPEQKYGPEVVKAATDAFKPWYQYGANELDKERYVEKYMKDQEAAKQKQAEISKLFNQPPVPVEPAKPTETDTALAKADTAITKASAAIEHSNKVSADAEKARLAEVEKARVAAIPATEPVKVEAAAPEPKKPLPVAAAAATPPAALPTVAAPPLAPPGPTPNMDAAAQVSTAMNTAVSSLVSTSSTFATTFTAGAQAIGTAGTLAAGSLTSAAPGIGSAIGASAAAAIKAAVSNLNINVNANVTGGGADNGSLKAATGK
jgi:hypothetical protein